MMPRLTGILLLLAGFALPAHAQDEETAAARQAAEATRDVREARETAAERDALEPSVPSAVLAADVERTTDGGRVMDEMDLRRTEITGNQELPKVLYIVPWQKSDPGELMGKPVNTLLDEVLAPIDRGEFVRQVDYYDDLHGQDDLVNDQ